MTKSNKDWSSPKSEREDLMDAILGPDEEMDDDLADEILNSYGLRGPQLVEEFKLLVEAELKRHYQETSEISKPLEVALRSIIDQQRSAQPAPVQADSWIEAFLAGNVSSGASSRFLYSFHKQKEGSVSEKDKELLDELERELEGSDAT